MSDKPMTVDDVKRMLKAGGKWPLPPEAEAAVPAADIEATLEAETGKDVVQTGKNPPTYVETDKPAPPAVPKPQRKPTRGEA